MQTEKLDPQLAVALTLTEDELMQSPELAAGYDETEALWELVIQYVGDFETVAEALQLSVTYLYGDYAIIRIKESDIGRLLEYPEVAFLEKPRLLTRMDEEMAEREPVYGRGMEGIAASCIPQLWAALYHLSGKGVLIGIVDSGIDYTHPDFRNADGTTRILGIWDQTAEGNPPVGFDFGAYYSETQINEALLIKDKRERQRLVPTTDRSGHGTHVAGIAAGNGRASQGRIVGVAPEASLLIVKLGDRQGGDISKTTSLFSAVTFLAKMGEQLSMPLIINLSYGNNYGAHDGSAFLERYLGGLASGARRSIVVGTGNEGAAGRHASLFLQAGETGYVEWTVSPMEKALSLQVWAQPADRYLITVVAPDGQRMGPVRMGSVEQGGQEQRFVNGAGTVIFYLEAATPYNRKRQLFISFLSGKHVGTGSLPTGIWRLEAEAGRVQSGNLELWLPVTEATGGNTAFLTPSPEGTLTIPSSAASVISVGAYNSMYDSQAAFSGRGFGVSRMRSGAYDAETVKPDLVAPGVDIRAAAPEGGYTLRSGTSMATPFVAGTAALLMEWGIVRGNDRFLYGEKLRAALIAGARPLPGFYSFPNPQLGWGALCGYRSVKNSF